MCDNSPKILLGFLSVLVLVLASCAPAAGPTATSKAPTGEKPTAKTTLPTPSTKTLQQPRYGGILTRAMDRDVASFDVQREQGADASQTLFNVYQGLVRLHPTEHRPIMPELAESWEISPDGKGYTFKLYKNVKWHDDKPLTTEDVMYSLDRMQNPRKYKTISPRGEALLAAMAKAEIVGDGAVRITTKYPSAAFLRFIATGWIAIEPKHILEAKGDMRRDLVGTGPFKLKQFNPNVSLELEKNANYHIKGVPYLDGIRFYSVRDGTARFAAFRTGRVQTTTLGNPELTPAEAEIVKREMADKAIVYQHDGLSVGQVSFNMTRKPWNDLRVRKAVDLAFDRQAAIKVAGPSYLSGLYVGGWASKPEEIEKLPGRRQPKDPDIAEAKKLMSEAGLADGIKTTMLPFPGVYFEQQALVAKDQLARIGIDAEVNLLERSVFDERVSRGAFDLLSVSWNLNTDDPDETLLSQYTSTGTRAFGFTDKVIDELFEKQTGTMDESARRVILTEIERRVLVQVPAVLVLTRYKLAGVWKEVKNFNPGPGLHPWGKIDQVWLAQ